MVSVFLWPQCGQVRVAVRTVMQGILSRRNQAQGFDERREGRW